MTKPSNLPEAKRQRQIKALARIKPHTKGKKNTPSKSNATEIATLKAAVARGNQRHTHSNKV